MIAGEQRPRGDRHDRRCAERIRTRRLLQAAEPAKPPVWLLHQIAGEIWECCGHSRLKAYRLAYGWTLGEAVAAVHALCQEQGLGTRGLTDRSWLEWEAGAKPNGDYQDLLCRLFVTGPVQLGFATDYGETVEGVGEPAVAPLPLGRPGDGIEVGEATDRRYACKGIGAAVVSPVALKGALVDALEFTRRAGTSAVGAGVLEHLELAVADFNRASEVVSPAALFGEVRWYRQAVDRLIAGPHTLREGRQLYAHAGWLSELLAWLARDLGNPATAWAYGVDAWHYGWQAGHEELCAWALNAQASIALHYNQPGQALEAVLRGAQHAPAGHPVTIMLAAKAAPAYARLGQQSEFKAALRDAVDLHERLAGQPLTVFGRDAGLLASYAVTSHAAQSCNWVGLPEQARRYATDGLDLLTAVPEEDRIPGKEAVARIELALALVGLGAPDEACGLGRQALVFERLVGPLRARALDLDAALQRTYPDLPEAREFHERCRLLAPSPSPDLAT